MCFKDFEQFEIQKLALLILLTPRGYGLDEEKGVMIDSDISYIHMIYLLLFNQMLELSHHMDIM